MIPRHVVDVDADDAVAEALARFAPAIRGYARRIAAGGAELAADLEQEAAIGLWQLDPTRFDDSDDKYLRSALFKRMLRAARTERRASGGIRRLSLSQ